MSSTPTFRPERPNRLGAYRVLSELGRGGSGVVYRALSADGTEVAIKTLGRVSEDGLASLRGEIHALRRLRHPGVVRVFDDGMEGERPWFAMELLQGETLADYARRMPRPATRDGRPTWTAAGLEPVLRLVAAICTPLAALHENGVVHRDLKPENIFLRGGGSPVIMDFGLARHHLNRDARAIAEPLPVAGTLAYMAPEQLTGELIDARTDLYALGCILYELLVGSPPPSARRALAARPAARPADHVGGLPAALEALVESLLRARPRERIGHAADVRAWLASILDPAAPHETITSGRHPWLYRPVLSGRAEPISTLFAGLGRARRGRGSFMVVEGESGIGKTHVVYEIARRATDDCSIVPVASDPPGAASTSPLSAWSRFFERVVDRSLVDPESTVADLVGRHIAVLRGLHGVFSRFDATAATAPHPPARDEVAALLRDLVGAMCEERPVILVLDDLQWADELTLAVLTLMTDAWLAQRPLLLLATCRSDESFAELNSVLASPGITRVELGPLPEAGLRDLIADMLGVGEPPDSVVEWIARRADGNPFVAAEYLRLVVAELPIERELALPVVRILAPSPRRLDELAPPSSVRELVGRRIQALDEGCRHLAELVAVLGGTLDASAYARLAEDVAMRDALLELDRRQLTEPTADGGRRLPHDRVRVVVYEALTPARRRDLHREAAVLLSSLAFPKERADAPHAALARHFLLAEMPAAALPNLEKAGELALSRAAYSAAADHFRSVLETSRSVGGATFSPARRGRWAHGSARAAFGTGDLEGCEAHVREALALVGRTLPRTRAGWPLLALVEALKHGTQTPSLPSANAHAHAHAHEGTTTLLSDVAQATSLLPYRYFFEEDLVPLVASSLLAANLARAADPKTILPAPFSLLAAMLGLFRLSGPARTFFDRAESAAMAAGDWREGANAYALESVYQGSFARWPAAEEAARKALAACERSSDPWLRENVETTLSHVEFFTGRFDVARRRAEFVAQSSIERQNVQHEVWGLFLQARSDIPGARYDAARALLERASAHLQARPEAISEIACNGMLAHVLWSQGEKPRAEALATRVNEQVKARLPPAYPSLVGYASAAFVHRAAFETSPSPSRWRAARDMGVALWRFAAVFPVAVPAAHLHAAHLLRLAGWRRTSHSVFLRGAALATRAGMPRERGLLLHGASSTADEPEKRTRLRSDAEAILQSIGCSLEMF